MVILPHLIIPLLQHLHTLEVSGRCQQSHLGHVGIPLVLEIFDSQLLLALRTEAQILCLDSL